MKTKTLFFIVTLLVSTFSFASNLPSEADLAKLRKGELIKTVTWKEGLIWPEVTIMALINHTPSENMSVFVDFDTHKNYIPDMLESQVIKEVSPTQKHVRFLMEMPWPVKRTGHVTNNILTKSKDGIYNLKWNLVKADMLKDTYGHIQFENFEGKTLMRYSNQIVPNSSFAGMFKSRVAKDVEHSVQEIIKHLDKTIKKKDSNFLGQVSKLEEVFKSQSL